MYKLRFLFFAFVLLSFSFCYCQNNNQEERKQAEAIFQKVHEICMLDNGDLCGINLYCPLLLVDRESRFVYSNVPLSFSDTPPMNGLYTGILPNNYLISNSTIYIDSILYTIFAFEKSVGADMLIEVAIHEMFHYWQEKNDWHYSSPYNNTQMETKWGRIYLKLEMKAIQKALSSKNDQEKENTINEALYFRNQRQILFSDRIADEIAFEIHEGMPDFVRYTLCVENDSQIKLRLVDEIEKSLNEGKFIRTFGYLTGSSYAFLINNPTLLKDAYIDGKDLTKILKETMSIGSLPDSLSSTILKEYNYEAIAFQEDSIEKTKTAFNNRIKQQFQESKKLIIDLEGVTFGFNPSEVYSIDNIGTYYPFISVAGEFGQI